MPERGETVEHKVVVVFLVNVGLMVRREKGGTAALLAAAAGMGDK
jgi:hypothetical protein